MKIKSFTLIELLVVIVIIGILAGVIVVSTSSAINKANFAKAQAFSSTVQNELLNDLVSEWTFDNASNPGEDTWGNNDGTVVGATYQLKSSGNCVYGGCYSFDGDDHIEVVGSDTTTSSLAITGAITLSAWVKFDRNLISEDILTRGYPWSAGDYGYSLWRYSDDRIYFDTFNVGQRDSLILDVMSDHDWHHIIGTWDGTTNANGKKIYMDGSLKKQKASTVSSIGQAVFNFRIGVGANNQNFFKGFIDDARVYNSSISTAEVKREYLAGLDSLLASNNISKEEYYQRMNNLAFEE